MILSDRTITDLCTPPYVHDHISRTIHFSEHTTANETDPLRSIDNRGQPMITPFNPLSIKKNEQGGGIASYGLSSYGYDIRAAPEFKIFKGYPNNGVLDYKRLDEDAFDYVEDSTVIIPPNGFILARSVEYVKLPRNVLGIVVGKSTIARVGINCLCTPLEPEWEGHITLEFHNGTNLPNRFYANEGVLQLLFLVGDQPCKTSYADRKGKYQSQPGEIVLPRV